MARLANFFTAASTLLIAATATFAQAPTAAKAETKTKPIAAVIYSTRGDEQVHVLAADDLRLLGSIDAKAGLHELALDSTGRFVMGSAYGGPNPGHQPADNRLVVIDLAANAVHRTIKLEGMQRPNDIAFKPGSFEAFVTVESPPHILRVDAESGEVAKFPIKHKSGHMLALSPDAKTVYVSHVQPGSLTVLDAASGEEKKSITLPLGAEGMTCSPDGRSVWIASHAEGRVSVVDTETNEVSQSIIAPGMPFRVRISPDGKLVAIAAPQAGAVAFIETREPTRIQYVDTNVFDNKPISRVMTPTSIAFSPDGTSLFAVCEGEDPRIVAIDVATRKVRAHTLAKGPIADAMTTGVIQWAGT